VKIDFSGLCSADMYPLSTDLNQSYFHYFLLSDPFLAQVTTGDNRVAMPKVNQQQLNLVLVPIPPLKEQSRIVACVDELMSHLNRLENSINNFIGLSADFSKAAVHHIDL